MFLEQRQRGRHRQIWRGGRDSSPQPARSGARHPPRLAKGRGELANPASPWPLAIPPPPPPPPPRGAPVSLGSAPLWAAARALAIPPALVTFYGCTSSRSRELLLVYEFVPNGTVADHLHGHHATERALAWPLRLSIAVEAATALAYLHAVEPPVVHRDVKTSNILLDANFHVKVADFGLSRLFPLDATHVSTAPQGTPGYVDPEYHQCYQLTDKSDVYSFGVVLVELISSKPAVDVTRGRNEINLAGMAVNRIQRCQVGQLVDLELGYGSDEATRKMMTMVAELAFRCLQQNGEVRPPIREVLDVLRGIQEGGFVEEKGGKKDGLVVPRSPDTVHAPWDSMSTTPSISH